MEPNVVVLVTRDGLGQVQPQDHRFGLEMLERFLHTLESQPVKPQVICFYTEGVKLVCNGSPVLPNLQLLQGMGIRLVACQTCLTHFGLRNQVAVGEVGGMSDIVALLMAADRVVTV